MLKKHVSKGHGFTLVELLIVIVVIGVLSTITVVAYSGIQKRANRVVLQSELTQARAHLAMQEIEEGSYPGSIEDLKGGSGVEYEYTASEDSYCLTARFDDDRVPPHHVTDRSGVTLGPCQGHAYGSLAPVDTNLVAPLSQWTLTGGATYSSDTNEITFTSYGTAGSPKTRIDGPASWRLSAEVNSPSKPADSEGRGQRLYGSNYFDNDGNSFVVPGGWASNGNAAWLTADSWQETSYGSGFSQVDPDLTYISLTISVNSSYGVIGSKVRNPEITITR